MSEQRGGKGGGDGKRRVVIRLPPGSPLDKLSQDEIDKHIQALIGKAGIDNREVGPVDELGAVDELLIEIADSSSPTTLAPGDGWAARWSRRCAI